MSRTTKKYLEGRFQRFARQVPAPEGYHWTLSCYNPGDGRNRYQIQLIRDANYGEAMSFPHGGHWPTGDFNSYLDGLLAGIEDVPLVEKRFFGGR